MLNSYIPGYIDLIWPFLLVLLIGILFYIYRDRILQSHWRYDIPKLLLIIVLTTNGHYLTVFAKIPFVSLSETFSGFPLHLCNVSSILIMLYIGFKKEVFFDILLLQSIIGAIVTFIFPDISYERSNFYYWNFYFSHIMLFVVPLFYIIVENIKVEKKHLNIGLLAIHVNAFIAILVNLNFDTHYMFLTTDNSTNLFSFIPVLDVMPFLDNIFGLLLVGEILTICVYTGLWYFIRRLQGSN